MTITIVQTCNKCKKERNLRAGSSGGQLTIEKQQGGWRPFDGDKDVCPDCLREFVSSLT